MATTGFQNPPVVTPVKSPIPDKEVNTSLQGTVLDEKNVPVAGATIKCGNATTNTDAKGNFRIAGVNANEVAAVVRVEKNGYFPGLRTFHIAEPGMLQYVQVQLLPKKAAGTFNAASGGSITTSNAQFTFVAQQVLGADNKPYSGTVSLFYAPIDPEDDHFEDIMPGDLRGISSSNALVGLKSYGMMALELQSATGEKLHLDTTKSVAFKMTIPAGLQSSAPATIPLWHFEESSGVWREEGSATKTGNSYTGTVKHFSFWNCDAPFPVVKFRATFQDVNGTPLSNLKLRMERTDGSSATNGYTNENGVVSGDIPKGEVLKLQAVNKCDVAIDTRNIGPFQDSTNIGVLKIAITPENYIHFSGAVTTCDNVPVQKGVVNIEVDGIVYRAAVTSGKYNIGILRCQDDVATATINAEDEAGGKMTTVTLPVTVGAYVRNLAACDLIQPDFINTLFNGKPINFASPDMITFQRFGQTGLFSGSKSDGTATYLSMQNTAPGTYPSSSLQFSSAGKYYHGTGTYTVTGSGSVGDYFTGSFTGTVSQDSVANPVPYPLSGSFRIRITQ